MTTYLEPLGDNIVIEVAEVAELESGLILPDETKAKMRPQEGTVIAIGPTVQRVAVNDVVIFSKYDGHSMDEENRTLRICSEASHIYAIRKQA